LMKRCPGVTKSWAGKIDIIEVRWKVQGSEVWGFALWASTPQAGFRVQGSGFKVSQLNSLRSISSIYLTGQAGFPPSPYRLRRAGKAQGWKVQGSEVQRFRAGRFKVQGFKVTLNGER
jgi:hypothetical protein